MPRRDEELLVDIEVRRDIIWPALTDEVPAIREQVVSILRSEFPLVARALDEHDGRSAG